MQQIAMAIHGGAGADSQFIRENKEGYEEGLRKAITAGYQILEKGGLALDAVEVAVRILEDDPLFNAGRGSALNNNGEVEMDASIMDGKRMKTGAVSLVTNVKNPVSLARLVLENTNHVFLSGNGALQFGKTQDVEFEPDSYFITDHQMKELSEACKPENVRQLLKKKAHGTVGAVAVDKQGNVAAATSTGGTCNCMTGRVGDSCIIGAGTYANNNTCAVSGTGDGELLINGVIAHAVSSVCQYTHKTLQEACGLVIHEYNKDVEGYLGVICVNAKGDFGISFNTKRMHRGLMSSTIPLRIKIY